MKIEQKIFVPLFLISLFLGPGGSLAQTIYTDIGGDTSKQGASPLNCSGTTFPQGITISNCTIEIRSDGVQDYLVLKSARITATTGAVTNFPIAFWATLSTKPDTPQNFEVKANGELRRGNGMAGTNNSITIKGWMEHPVGTSPSQIGPDLYHKVNNPAQASFNKSTPTPPTVNLDANNRTLKAELVLTLTQVNDYAQFSATNGVAVKDTSATMGNNKDKEKDKDKQKKQGKAKK